ncbi:MAG: pyridoxal phosphate synthase yaaE subunit, glutamine amidotransferase [Candidatus Peregrinibacteria bacterium GW2011_GWF2_38_29]|nr:MAG: pyridoxal phosphate synthase yaaE subunit, glutamine amidotransferase [Candidatus Peregrinibacteria bacterium GW2011_GWF2_38_29]HBB03246.1 pyridoxal 5'-phosphate synthase glutaminase subunit PdxT [Candidatus Peregrinibacteria bacterium]
MRNAETKTQKSKLKAQNHSSKVKAVGRKVKIGVLDIQGSVEEHAMMLEECGAEVVFVKTVRDLENIRGLIIPGGESTHISMMLKRGGLFDTIKKKIKSGMAVYGTCAGAILLAKKILGDNGSIGVKSFNVIDAEIERNAYGRQTDSFEVDVEIPVLGEKVGYKGNVTRKKVRDFPAIFIRAPKIKSVGKNVEILAKYKNEIVMAEGKFGNAQKNNILISTFHPELTNDIRVHEYFIKMAA